MRRLEPEAVSLKITSHTFRPLWKEINKGRVGPIDSAPVREVRGNRKALCRTAASSGWRRATNRPTCCGGSTYGKDAGDGVEPALYRRAEGPRLTATAGIQGIMETEEANEQFWCSSAIDTC